MVFQNNVLAGGAGGSGTTTYAIDQSIRFNDDDSPSLDKTYSGAGSRTTFTFSCWFKLGGYFSGTGAMPFFNGGTGASDTGWTGVGIRYDGSGAGIAVQGYNTNWKITTRKFRDHSAWYHLVAVWDTTNAVASERVRIYINGQRETDFSTSNDPSASAQAGIGQAVKHSIGYQSRSVGYSYADMYMAELVYIDGTALDPSSFGEYNSSGIWIPKDVSELTFGTNGFHIDGRDSADLGDDESGNGNDFTTSGLAAHDQVADSPTNNFAVINSVYSTRTTSGAGSTHTIEDGNLYQQADSYSTSNYGTRPFTVQPLNRGKWYFEFEGNTEAGGGNLVHVVISEEEAFYAAQGAQSTNRYGLYLEAGSAMYILYPGASRQETNAPIAQYTKIIGCAIDFDNAKMYFFVDGVEIYGQDIAAGTAATNLSGWSTSSNWIIQFATVVASDNSARSNIMFNFGQEGTFSGTQSAGGNSDGNGIGNFKHSVPSGYLALCTSNLGS